MKANNLNMLKETAYPGTDGIFDVLFEQFTETNQGQNMKDDEPYLRRKRLIAMVDRRKYAKKADESGDDEAMEDLKDTVFMYDPPENARHIPENAVPEWYLGASKMCLLPDMEYGTESDNGTIGALNSCQGSILTLSFHVKREDAVKLYLFWNGGGIRFMPEDIKVVLPMLFNMKYGDNEQWIKGIEI